MAEEQKFKTWAEWSKEDKRRWAKVLKARKILEGAEKNYTEWVWNQSLKPADDGSANPWIPKTGERQDKHTISEKKGEEKENKEG